MKKAIALSLIGSLTFAFASEKNIPRQPKKYDLEYYVPVIRFQPEVIQHYSNGISKKLKAELQGYKVAKEPGVEVKVDGVRNIYHIPTGSRSSIIGIIRRGSIRDSGVAEAYIPYSGPIQQFEYRRYADYYIVCRLPSRRYCYVEYPNYSNHSHDSGG